jgi:hypothetical protein
LPAVTKGGKNYSLFVDLSAIRYAISSSVTSPQIGVLLKSALDNKAGASSKIELVLIPDGEFLELQSTEDMNKLVSINLNRWRSASNKDFSGIKDAFKTLQENPDSDFRFGHEEFGIRTKEKSGKGYIAISIWVDDRPVDEISVPICVVDSYTKASIAQCDQLKPTQYSFRGVNPFSHGSLPDAALHLVQLNSSTLAGVFACGKCQPTTQSKYIAWILRNSPVTLREALNNQVVVPFENMTLGTDDKANKQLLDGGKALYNLIFQDKSGRVEPSDAETAFRDFIKEAYQSEEKLKQENSSSNPVPAALPVPSSKAGAIASTKTRTAPQSLFVRLLPESPDIAYAVPLDLMVVPVSDDRDEFVGFNVKVESPMEVQDYSVPSSCIDSWRLFVPGPDFGESTPMGMAVHPFLPDVTMFRAWKTHAKVDFTVEEFDGWIGQRTQSPQSTAIVTLSHHASGKLCFTGESCKEESVKEANIWRGFPHPSLAVINACGTSAPGASEFVRHLNARGVQTVIATSTAVDGSMAGQFLHNLIERLRTSKDPDYTVSDAKFDAVKDLRATYGPRALVYSFLGNDSIKVCVPPRPAN